MPEKPQMYLVEEIRHLTLAQSCLDSRHEIQVYLNQTDPGCRRVPLSSLRQCINQFFVDPAT